MRLDMRAGHRRYALGTYEPEVSSLIQSHLGGGETVLDIGANIGYFSLLMAHMVGPTGRVIAFEPFPPVYAMLCENLQLNNLYWVQAERMAVADREGEMRIQSEPDNPLSSTVRLSESGDLTVSLISLDHYAQTAGLTRVDFAKIDVEGAEDSVVRGVTKTLETFHPVVLVEIHSNDGGESEGLSKLKELGYQLKRLEDGEWVSCDTSARSGHVVGIP
jgi:FkbM family methyltransferase